MDAALPEDEPDPDSTPDGGASLNFDFPVDLATQYRPFAVANLYYWNNIVHDGPVPLEREHLRLWQTGGNNRACASCRTG